jgi:hypothetical protein
MYEQIHHLNVPSIDSFLEEVTGVKNPKVRWGALKYSSKKMYPYGTSNFAFVAERLAKHNFEWGHEIFFSLRARTPAPPPIGPKSPKKKSGKAAKTSRPRKKWVNRAPGSFVVDVDCGSSETAVKNARLLDCLRIAESRACLPTHIVYSRNGFHFYWAIKGDLDQVKMFDPESIWREAQKALAETYGGDPKIIGPNQMLRLPETLHWKNEILGFPVTWKRTDATAHPLDHILSAHGLKTLSQRFDEAFGSPSALDPSDPEPTPSAPANSPEKESEVPEKVETPTEIPFPEFEGDIYEAVRQALSKGRTDLEALKRYLGTDKGTLSCPFHEDSKPSARIFKTENGAFFKCYSSSCKIDFLDLQDAIKLNEGLSGRDLVIRTLEVLRCTDLVGRLKGEIRPPSKAIGDLYENRKILLDVKTPLFPSSYGLPKYYGTLKWVEPFLQQFLSLAKAKIRNSEGTFLASLKEISRRKNPKRAAIKLYLLRLSGLIELAQVPEACRPSQENFKARKKRRIDTSWHKIPLWTPESLAKAFQILAMAYSVGINTRSCSRKQVREAFGVEAESRVFFAESTLPMDKRMPCEDVLEDDQLRMDWIDSLTEEEIEREFGPYKPDEPDDPTEGLLGEDREVA